MRNKLENLKLGINQIESILRNYISNETLENTTYKGKAFYFIAELSKIKGDPDNEVIEKYKQAVDFFQDYGSINFLLSPKRLILYEWYKIKT